MRYVRGKKGFVSVWYLSFLLLISFLCAQIMENEQNKLKAAMNLDMYYDNLKDEVNIVYDLKKNQQKMKEDGTYSVNGTEYVLENRNGAVYVSVCSTGLQMILWPDVDSGRIMDYEVSQSSEEVFLPAESDEFSH